MSYNAKVYRKQGGNELVVGVGGLLTITGAVTGLSPGGNYYVDSGAGSSSNDGLSWATAKATIAQGLDLCTASNGDVVHVAPGHNEGFGAATLDLDVAGVTILGYGLGTARPRIDFDHANASINVQASSVALVNFQLLPSVTVVAIGIDVEAAVTDTLLQDIEILPGEDGGGVDEFVLGVDLKAGCTRTTIRRLKARQHASATGTNAVISLTGASDDVLIEDCDLAIAGAGAVAPIKGITTLSTNVRIKRCTLQADDEPGIELLTGTTGIIQDCDVFSNLATIDGAIVADACALFENRYVEVGGEASAATYIGVPSVDD